MLNSILEKDLKGMVTNKESKLIVSYIYSDSVKPRFELEIIINNKDVFVINTWEGYRKQYCSFESLLVWAKKNEIKNVILKPITF